MKPMKLTGARAPASFPSIDERGRGAMRSNRLWTATSLVLGASALGGCINVAAPEEPIVIELNINIRQEVIYRLAEDAAETIDENSGIF